MAYEYERYIKNLISVESIFEHEIEERIDRELEIKEVYAKAKAFDEISQVFKKVTIYNTATALEVKEILDNLEDK